MKQIILLAGCIVAPLIGSSIWINRKEFHKNMKQLNWMVFHLGKFNPPATPDEKSAIFQEIKDQEHWYFYSYNVFIPPQVDWADLPMDDEYVKFFNKD